ncbi:MAG: hypothetical protein BWY80_00920 [Firmicutes bacterium ADurb.Bin456]|nr:MAG: hypothetical protein BWY80_00920 [Firmicutes bacterium ADurb.Bin456]
MLIYEPCADTQPFVNPIQTAPFLSMVLFIPATPKSNMKPALPAQGKPVNTQGIVAICKILKLKIPYSLYNPVKPKAVRIRVAAQKVRTTRLSPQPPNSKWWCSGLIRNTRRPVV